MPNNWLMIFSKMDFDRLSTLEISASRQTKLIVKKLIKNTAIIIVGMIIGALTAFQAISTGWSVEVRENNTWRMHQNYASTELSIYAHAYLRRSGHLPLPQDQAIYFFSYDDSDGNGLTANCDYEIIGDEFNVYWWSLSLHDSEFVKIENPSRRYSFNMANIVRKPDGQYKISISAQAKTGNWLPVSEKAAQEGAAFMLSLRLYGVERIMIGDAEQLNLPSLKKMGCRE